jgi:uncharacterized protein (DUF1697 family)
MIRGINVVGAKIIRMEELRKMYAGMGFKNVRSWLQSGNVVFQTRKTGIPALEKKIIVQIKKKFGYDVNVIILTIGKLKKIIQGNSLARDKKKETIYLHVTFLAAAPGEYKPEDILLKKQTGEEIVITKEAVYLYCPLGYGNTRLGNNFLESCLRTSATTRNWRSTNEILKLAEKIAE